MPAEGSSGWRFINSLSSQRKILRLVRRNGGDDPFFVFVKDRMIQETKPRERVLTWPFPFTASPGVQLHGLYTGGLPGFQALALGVLAPFCFTFVTVQFRARADRKTLSHAAGICQLHRTSVEIFLCSSSLTVHISSSA